MKDKIFAALKTKYADKRLSDKTLNAVADMLALTVTEEAGIDAAVTGVEPLVSTFQAETGVAVTKALTKAKTDAKSDDTKNEDDKTPPPINTQPPTDEVPAWAKTLIEQNKTLSDEITAIKSGKATESRQSQLTTALKDAGSFKDVTLKDFARINFKDDEDFAAYLAEKTADAKGFVQTQANTKLGAMGIPVAGQNVDSNAPASKEEVANVTKLFK